MTSPDALISSPPGSRKALAEGCTCPTIDNHHGAGYRGHPSRYAVNVTYPLHGARDFTDSAACPGFETIYVDRR